MKMAKPSEQDIDAGGNLMALLNDIDSGYYPFGKDDDDAPMFFDEDDPKHLRQFYDAVKATLDSAPGWHGRVIGGMCYVIMYDKNEIVDPESDVIDLHPKLVKALEVAEQAPVQNAEEVRLLPQYAMERNGQVAHYYRVDDVQRAFAGKEAAAAEAPSQWVSVEDSLPAPETDVLIIRLGQVRVGAIFIEHESWEEGGREIHYWDDPNDDGQGWDWCEVTHWMPLPAAPQQSAQGEKGGDA